MMDYHSFEHEAMHTTFCLRLPGSILEARGLAQECFRQLDYLESRLSLFMDGSDIWQLNRMKAGQSLFISPECHACLLFALKVKEQSGGVFDIAYGGAVHGRLIIEPGRPRVTCEIEGSRLDLGGIGKGFALDNLRTLLADWQVDRALLSAGASTHLAIGPEAWPIRLDADDHWHPLKNAALSASGTGIQGGHIRNPVSPGRPLQSRTIRVLAPTGALADAWSTAAFLLSPVEAAGVLPTYVQILESPAGNGMPS